MNAKYATIEIMEKEDEAFEIIIQQLEGGTDCMCLSYQLTSSKSLFCTPMESFTKLNLREFWLKIIKYAKKIRNSRKIIMLFKSNFKVSFVHGSSVFRLYSRIFIHE